VLEKLSLALRLMRENDDRDSGSLKLAFFVCAAILILINVSATPVMSRSQKQSVGSIGGTTLERNSVESISMTAIFLAVISLPPILSFLSAKAVGTLYFSPSQAWLTLTEITNQEFIWAYTIHVLYRLRRILLIGIMMPNGILLIYLNERSILCFTIFGSSCSSGSIVGIAWSLIPAFALVSFLFGLYLLAISVGVHAALRFKTKRMMYATAGMDLLINVVILVVMTQFIWLTRGNFLMLILSLLLPYLLAFIIMRIARYWLWKPALRSTSGS
jgi:hypothetical protein